MTARRHGSYQRGRPYASRKARAGGLFSLELVIALPLLVGLFLGMAEFGILLVSHQQLENGCRQACRTATLPGFDRDELPAVVRQSLGSRRLAERVKIKKFNGGHFTGDCVELEVAVPMQAAAPDLLRIIGFSLAGRQLHARAAMRKE